MSQPEGEGAGFTVSPLSDNEKVTFTYGRVLYDVRWQPSFRSPYVRTPPHPENHHEIDTHPA
ncbi:hypothetical protein ACFQUX_16015 [Pantoea stewartii]